MESTKINNEVCDSPMKNYDNQLKLFHDDAKKIWEF